MHSAPGGPCPCGRRGERGRPLSFADCCARFVSGAEAAPDAEALMRSRYTAFVLEDASYLLATWHPSSRPPAIEFEPGLKWLGREVREHRALDDPHAEVE